MSEAMTNTEIEDVLSSIRRLVAQESRPEIRSAPERLVLTAELRVGTANLTVAPTGAAAPRTGQIGAPVDGPAAEDGQTARKLLDGDSPTASAIAELIAAQPRFDPQADRPAAPAAAPVDSPDAGPKRALDAETGGETGAGADREGLEATISALEAALGPAEGAGHSEATSGAPQDRPRDAPYDAPPDTAATVASGDGVAPTETLIDEADLENLVARLVREELRGQLGERITRQVRRLVRAEIARALDERKLLG